MLSGRLAATAGSSTLSVPEARLRGLMNSSSPAFSRARLTRSKFARVMITSPRTSSSAGTAAGVPRVPGAEPRVPSAPGAAPPSAWGRPRIVRTVWLTSSPTRPSPRVTARTNWPRS